MRGMLYRCVAAGFVVMAAGPAAWAQSEAPAAQTDAPPLAAAAPSGIVPVSAAPEAKPAVDPSEPPLAAGLTGIDAAVAEKLRNRVMAGLSRPIERKSDRAGTEAFYRARGFAPLWISEGKASARAGDAVAFLGGVDADALDPADYPGPQFASADSDKLAQDELAMTNSVLAFARHARTGRISFSRVSGAIHYDLKAPEAADVLAHMANATDTRDALDSYHPQHAGYRALKAKLAEARGQNRKANADTLAANMERWRWLPRELGKTHVIVNIPDFTLRVVDQDKTAWSTRIVVGKVGAQATPLFSDTMKYITVNPTWNVPPSIIRNEYLPALQRDPNALARIGLKMTNNSDGSIRIYQPPGERNALGRIRFNFPNRFLVYQHDTPDKHLFAKEQRTFSHGCMRVQNPEQYAEVLLSLSQPDSGFTADRIRKMFGTSERNIHLKSPIPVHLTYQTAFVDDANQLQTRPDVYGHDRAITDLLRNNRGSADTPVARNYNSSSKPVVSRQPSQPDSFAQQRAAGRNGERVARQFEYGGSTFYPRRSYGAPN